MDLDAVVDELYGMDPAQFTARRDALSAEARKAGDRGLAAAVKALRRPSAAAHAVNLMARANAEEIGRLIALGARMREAQAALSGDDLRALGRQRSQLVSGLAQQARSTARDAGHQISEATEREVQSTFEAALADEAAGEAVRAGRLIRALEHSGMDPVDLEGAVAGGPTQGRGPARAETTSRSTRPKRDGRDTDGTAGDQAERSRAAEEVEELARRKAEAEEQAARAEEASRRAEDRRAESAAAHDAARRRRAEAEGEVHRLEDELGTARGEADAALETERRARRALTEAEEEADAAASAARRARAEADALAP